MNELEALKLVVSPVTGTTEIGPYTEAVGIVTALIERVEKAELTTFGPYELARKLMREQFGSYVMMSVTVDAVLEHASDGLEVTLTRDQAKKVCEMVSHWGLPTTPYEQLDSMMTEAMSELGYLP